MFRKMRRFKQQLSNDEALKILKNCKSGVLAVSGDDGYPYTVPLNFVYKDDSEKLTTLFRSVVVFGKAEIMENEEKINSAMLSFGLKYNNDINAVKKEIERERSGLCCVEITIEHITGKQAIELLRKNM